MLEELAERHPTVRETLLDRRELATGAVPELVQAVRREIAERSAQPAWHHDWDDTGSIPDYSRVRERLEALLAQGHTKEVLMLGEELFEADTQQVEMSQDEGETAEEIATCLTVVFRALVQSSRPPGEQLRWLVARIKQDEFDLCTQGLDSFWQHTRSVADWQRLAEAMTLALDQDKASVNRDLWTDWLIIALKHAGRHDEIIPLCEREASKTGNYLRLVARLQAAERWDEAEHWVRRGLHALRSQASHEVSYLRTALRDLRERAITIWQALAKTEIARTNTPAYETAAGYLRKVRDVLHQLGRQAEWQSYFTALRQANVRKRRLVEILDNLGERRIIKRT